jgi:hypothetical protein
MERRSPRATLLITGWWIEESLSVDEQLVLVVKVFVPSVAVMT